MGFAAFVQSLGGFGFALLAVPLAAVAIDLTTAVVAISIASIFNVVMLTLRTWRDIDRAVAVRFNVAALFGMPFGLVVLATVDQQRLKVLLGVFIIVATLALMRGAGAVTARTWIDYVAGWISGVLAASTGTNGPPLVIAAQMRRLPPHVFRATLTFTFVISGPLSLVFFAFGGYFSWTAGWLALGAVPMIIGGQRLGLAMQSRVDGKRFEWFVYVLLFVSGASVAIAGAVG